MSTIIQDLIRTQRVIVLIGAGGVGKTTTSVAVALAAASYGRSVALLSIDPAKRLASALGISLGNSMSTIHFPLEFKISGRVDAAMLEQKAVFDGMVKKHAPSPHIADKILRDPLYLSASQSLSGPLEYMALAKLQELVEDPKYDLVVLDTPPDTHSLDFLGRPNILGAFMESKVISKILKPAAILGKFGLTKVMNASEKILGGISSVTGFSALARFGEFILLMQEVIDGFHRAGERVTETLKRPSTSFFLVTTPTSASARSAVFFANKLKEIGYALDTVVFNKSISDTAKAANAVEMMKHREKGEKQVIEYLKQELASIFDSHPPTVVEQQEQEQSLTDLKSLFHFAQKFT